MSKPGQLSDAVIVVSKSIVQREQVRSSISHPATCLCICISASGRTIVENRSKARGQASTMSPTTASVVGEVAGLVDRIRAAESAFGLERLAQTGALAMAW